MFSSRIDLELGPRPGLLAVVEQRLWVTDNGAASVTLLGSAGQAGLIADSAVRFGDWLVIGRRTVRRVTLTG